MYAYDIVLVAEQSSIHMMLLHQPACMVPSQNNSSPPRSMDESSVPGAANNDARMDIDTTMADTRPANRDFDSRKHRDSAKFDISSRA